MPCSTPPCRAPPGRAVRKSISQDAIHDSWLSVLLSLLPVSYRLKSVNAALFLWHIEASVHWRWQTRRHRTRVHQRLPSADARGRPGFLRLCARHHTAVPMNANKNDSACTSTFTPGPAARKKVGERKTVPISTTKTTKLASRLRRARRDFRPPPWCRQRYFSPHMASMQHVHPGNHPPLYANPKSVIRPENTPYTIPSMGFHRGMLSGPGS